MLVSELLRALSLLPSDAVVSVRVYDNRGGDTLEAEIDTVGISELSSGRVELLCSCAVDVGFDVFIYFDEQIEGEGN